MGKFIDLSHDFEDGMQGFKMKNEDGTFTQYSAHIDLFITQEESLHKYQGKVCFVGL